DYYRSAWSASLSGALF
nr:immunoglobulin light chain junction region [Macaca mulatta]